MHKKENPADQAVALCAEQVRRDDYERYVLTLFMPRKKRAGLWVLYAFNLELKKVGDKVKEPMMGLIRFQWWRDSISEIYRGKPLHHHVLKGLSFIIDEHNIPEIDLQSLINLYETKLENSAAINMAQLWEFCEAMGMLLGNLENCIMGSKIPEDVHKHIGGLYEVVALLSELQRMFLQGKIDLSLQIKNSLPKKAEKIEADLQPFLIKLRQLVDEKLILNTVAKQRLVSIKRTIIQLKSSALKKNDHSILALSHENKELFALSIILKRFLF